MLRSFEKIIKAVSNLSWDKLLMLFLLVLILLGGYFGYKAISQMDLSRDRHENSLRHFEEDYLFIDATIRDYLVELRYATSADWVLFLGVHDGVLKKISIIDEVIGIGNAPLYPDIQNIPYSRSRYAFPLTLPEDSVFVKERPLLPELSRKGISAGAITALYIEGYSDPIGFIGVYYKEEKRHFLKNVTNHLFITRELIKHELNRI